MFRIIASFIAVAGLFLGVAPQAEAHTSVYWGHNASASHYGIYYRSRIMPGWLNRDRDFHYWYVRTPLRFDHRLRWVELHDAYRWERRHRNRGVYRSMYVPRHSLRARNERRVERAWRKRDDRKRRHKNRRRNRDND